MNCFILMSNLVCNSRNKVKKKRRNKENQEINGTLIISYENNLERHQLSVLNIIINDIINDSYHLNLNNYLFFTL